MTSLYDISIPRLLNILTVMTNLLNKADEFAKEKNIDISEILTSRLYEDMNPFTFQVWMTCSTVRKTIDRLTGTAPAGTLGSADTAYTLEELHAMIADATALLQGITPESLEGKENVRVPCQLGPASFEAGLADFVHGYSIPTAFFHLNTLYSLLRSKGVPIGKPDYIRSFLKDFDFKGMDQE